MPTLTTLFSVEISSLLVILSSLFVGFSVYSIFSSKITAKIIPIPLIIINPNNVFFFIRFFNVFGNLRPFQIYKKEAIMGLT